MTDVYNIAKTTVERMTTERVIRCERFTASNQNYVFAVDTPQRQYVLRLNRNHHVAVSAIRLQQRLIQLDVPVAKFICVDLDEKYSECSALLMHRLPGNDVVHVYENLTTAEKISLAGEISALQLKTNGFLPDFGKYGIYSYNDTVQHLRDTWFDDVWQNIEYYLTFVNNVDAEKIKHILLKHKNNLNTIRPVSFLRDISERNVLVHDGKLSGIVDVDNVCFGDSLLVVALTEMALLEKNFDTVYTERWKENLKKIGGFDELAEIRFEIYRLFYALNFLRLHVSTTANGQKFSMNVAVLKQIVEQTLRQL